MMWWILTVLVMALMLFIVQRQRSVYRHAYRLIRFCDQIERARTPWQLDMIAIALTEYLCPLVGDKRYAALEQMTTNTIQLLIIRSKQLKMETQHGPVQR